VGNKLEDNYPILYRYTGGARKKLRTKFRFHDVKVDRHLSLNKQRSILVYYRKKNTCWLKPLPVLHFKGELLGCPNYR